MSAFIRWVATSVLLACCLLIVADFNQPVALAQSAPACDSQMCTMGTICNAMFVCPNSPPYYCDCIMGKCTCKRFG